MTAPAKLTFSISGMGCDGCVAAIENAVLQLQGVAYAGVSLNSGTMTIRPGHELDVSALTAKVSAMGYAIEAAMDGHGTVPVSSCPCYGYKDQA